MKIEYVTGNRGKFEEAQLVLHGWDLEQVNLEIIEIQGDRFEIATAKARDAMRILGKPVIVEDVSLCFNAWNGMPGPYIKDFLQALGPAGLAELILKEKDHGVQAICVVAYVVPGSEPILFEGLTEGIVVRPRGTLSHGDVSFNSCFQPVGYTQTFGEMTMEEHSRMSMRRSALINLRKYLEN